jgi:hypothetical protein
VILSRASGSGVAGSIPGQSICDLWWTNEEDEEDEEKEESKE